MLHKITGFHFETSCQPFDVFFEQHGGGGFAAVAAVEAVNFFEGLIVQFLELFIEVPRWFLLQFFEGSPQGFALLMHLFEQFSQGWNFHGFTFGFGVFKWVAHGQCFG